MQAEPPPAIGMMELPDPRGPITEDFKRGACYVAKIVTRGGRSLTATITISIPGGEFGCEKDK